MTQACDSTKYGDWLYMEPTRGGVTCREKNEQAEAEVVPSSSLVGPDQNEAQRCKKVCESKGDKF